MMNRTIYLVRHTRVAVEKGTCYGQADVGLAGTFPDEVRAIKEKLAGVFFTQVFCSPLSRCTQLASCLHETFVTDSRLLEMHFGDWEGARWEDIFSTQEGKAWFADYLHTRCPHGESYQDIRGRVLAFSKMLEHTEGNILVVAHAGVIRALLDVCRLAATDTLFDIPVPYGQIISMNESGYTHL